MQVSVFLDADVLLGAIRGDTTLRASVLELDAALRHVTSVTLFEVGFQGARHEQKHETQLRWLRDHAIQRLGFEPKVGQEFDRLMERDPGRARKMDLGDCLLAAFARSWRQQGKQVAIGTRNEKHLQHAGVPLVRDFLSRGP